MNYSNGPCEVRLVGRRRVFRFFDTMEQAVACRAEINALYNLVNATAPQVVAP